MTFKDMCDKIVKADFLRKKDGTKPTAKEIFESSPTGELYQIFEWYETAKIILKEKRIQNVRISKN